MAAPARNARKRAKARLFIRGTDINSDFGNVSRMFMCRFMKSQSGWSPCSALLRFLRMFSQRCTISVRFQSTTAPVARQPGRSSSLFASGANHLDGDSFLRPTPVTGASARSYCRSQIRAEDRHINQSRACVKILTTLDCLFLMLATRPALIPGVSRHFNPEFILDLHPCPFSKKKTA